MIKKIKSLAESSDPANRELALILAKAQQLSEQDIAASCSSLLDKCNNGTTYTKQLNDLAQLSESYPKMFSKFIAKL